MIAILVRLLSTAGLLTAVMGPSHAHPHVWVTVSTEVVFSPDGRVAAVRHHWSFDEMFSTFATQGLDSDKDGKLSREALQGLADVNVGSIKEFDYYTRVELNGTRASFKEAVDHWLEYGGGVLTLHFTLPLQTPAKTTTMEISVSDWSNYVDFKFVEQDPVRLLGAAPGCQFGLTSGSSFKPLFPVDPLRAPAPNMVSVNCPKSG